VSEVPSVYRLPSPEQVRLARQQKLDEAVRLAKRGLTHWQIAEQMGIEPKEAGHLIRSALSALAKRRMANAENYRQLLLERLDLAAQAIVDKVIDGDLASITEWRLLVAEAAKLTGLSKQAPQVTVVNNVLAVQEAAAAMFGLRHDPKPANSLAVLDAVDAGPGAAAALPAPLGA
jgi:hypothetical protein